MVKVVMRNEEVAHLLGRYSLAPEVLQDEIAASLKAGIDYGDEIAQHQIHVCAKSRDSVHLGRDFLASQ